MSSSSSPPAPLTTTQTEKDNNVDEKAATPGPFSGKGARFWLLFMALCVAEFLSALDALVVATALPTIVNDLNGRDFVWVGSAFTLASTAFLPWTGSLSNIWGRKPIMVGSLLFFGAGSAICGAASSMDMLIAGRTVQGVGSGGILSLVEIIISDLVPLRDRGPYFGIIGSVWAIASAVGPPVGGALASNSNWRWAFYMNLPITAVALVLVYLFLNLPIPQESWQKKLDRMDWIGNLLIITGTSASIIGLSWGGSTYPWSSFQVLVPLILGLFTLVFAVFYEAKFSSEPTIPFSILSNRTSLSGYLGSFLHSIVMTVIGFYLTVYFQAAKLDDALQASIHQIPTAFTVAPFAILAGASVAVFGVYVPQNAIGWVFLTAGVGSFISLQVDSPPPVWIGLQVLTAVGFGMLFPATNFTVLAPLKPSQNAHALAFFTFLRTFASTWGVTIGSTILTNELEKRMPASASLGRGGELAYAAIPRIPYLPDDVRPLVQEAYAGAMRVLWMVMTGICGLGLLSVLLMKEVPLATVTDEQWAMEPEKPKGKGKGKGKIAGEEEKVIGSGGDHGEPETRSLSSMSRSSGGH